MANILIIEDQKQLCQLYGSVLNKTKHHINLATLTPLSPVSGR